IERAAHGSLGIGEAEEQGPAERNGEQQRCEHDGGTCEQPFTMPVGPAAEALPGPDRIEALWFSHGCFRGLPFPPRSIGTGMGRESITRSLRGGTLRTS